MIDRELLAGEVVALVRHWLPPDTDPVDVVVDALLDEEGLGFDSIGLIDLLCACEERFEVSLPPDALLADPDRRVTVGDLADEIAARLDPGAP